VGDEGYVETVSSSTIPISTEAVLIASDNNIEEPMEAPGAMVEVIATTTSVHTADHTSSTNPHVATGRKSYKKKPTTPSYREELLLK
jgi:hypothetical protein